MALPHLPSPSFLKFADPEAASALPVRAWGWNNPGLATTAVLRAGCFNLREVAGGGQLIGGLRATLSHGVQHLQPHSCSHRRREPVEVWQQGTKV